MRPSCATSTRRSGSDASARSLGSGCIDRFAGEIAEQLRVSARCSERPALWTGSYQVLALPRISRGEARRFRAEVQGEPVSVLCVGQRIQFGRLLRQLFDRVDSPEPAGSRSLWNPAALARERADLVAVEVHPWSASRFRRTGWLIVPKAVRWRARTSSLPPERQSRSLRSNLRKAANGGYAVEIACPGPNEWREFLEGMAIPFARRRFGEHAWIPTRGYLRHLRARCQLVFLRQNGLRVGGVALVAKRDELWLALLGIRGGDPQLAADGTITALYLATLERAQAHGLEWIDAGQTTSFLLDGVVRYKTKWGFAPVVDPTAGLLAVRVDPRNELIGSVFARQPLLILTEHGLRRLSG